MAASWAPAVQARALARLGQVDATRAAVHRAQELFTRLEVRPDERDAYGYTAAQLNFYRSCALTQIGDTEAAKEAQRVALAEYGPEVHLDTSLVRLDGAICLLHEDEPEEAARKASRLLMSLPAEHHSPIVIDQARRVYSLVPYEQRGLPAVQEFKEVLAIGAAQ